MEPLRIGVLGAARIAELVGRDLAPGAINGPSRLLAKEVHTGSVTKTLSQVGHHRLKNAWVNRRRGAVI